MPPAAMMAGGLASSAIGSLVSAKAGQPKAVPTTAPNALFPQLNRQYGNDLQTAGPQAVQGLSQMARTGNPVDVGDAFSQMLQAQQKTMAQGRAGLREQFGSTGMMGSSSFKNAAVDFENQANKDFTSQFANMLMASKENAAQRQLGAQGMLADAYGTAGQSYTPSSTLVSGAPSAVGTSLSSMGNMLSLFGLMKKP